MLISLPARNSDSASQYCSRVCRDKSDSHCVVYLFGSERLHTNVHVRWMSTTNRLLGWRRLHAMQAFIPAYPGKRSCILCQPKVSPHLKGCVQPGKKLLGLALADWLFHVLTYHTVPGQASSIHPYAAMIPVKSRIDPGALLRVSCSRHSCLHVCLIWLSSY